ncbi:hypothetical protein [Pseudomonas ekonensis]|nr:hypothetical protein [Pseudomonas ekonensis]
MKLTIFAGVLTSIAMMGAANAATCPTLSYTSSGGGEDLIFSSARLKDKDAASSVVICRYEGTEDQGATSSLRLGVPVQATGSGWKGDDCAVTDGDATKCSFK